MPPITVRINTKQVSDLVDSLRRFAGDPLRWILPWGNAVAKEARETARDKGGRSFWRQIAAATRVATVSADSVEVANWHVAGGHKQTGGPIRAKNVAMLTIPISDEARGKRASEFEDGGRDLFTVPARSGNRVLGYADIDGFHGLFVLVKETRSQAADPWFPTEARIGEIGLAEAFRMLEKSA